MGEESLFLIQQNGYRRREPGTSGINACIHIPDNSV